ncbi:MAG: hypothetical protein A3G91_00115 [Omnitrophica WOR_2 bacterium RIFCSPLOWO2_12_FULL_50_9]|nr:MAG: hypothetical protein A3G91_00115 [Omnitrophica WOR_2 bacterium RIFCSPLOWO2_12_FULL_50_9]
MMKKYLLTVIFIGALTHPGFAQTSPHGSAEAMLELSLAGLKESFRNLADKNDFLASEITGYEKHIQSLDEELKFLEARKHALLRKREQGGPVETGRKEDVDVKIKALQADIARLQAKTGMVSAGASPRLSKGQGNALGVSVRQSRRNVRKAQRDLARIEKESARPLKTIEHLRQRQTALKHQLPDSRDWIHQRLAVLKEDNIRLKKEAASLEQALPQHPHAAGY